MKKRVLALLLAVTMVVGLTACGGSSESTSSTEGETAASTDGAAGTEAEVETTSTGEKILSVQVGPDPETIDPALNSAVDGGNMLLHSFECLLSVDQDGKLIPGQAESWET
ncbi:MAG: peptide ABC transporter substrate-binding protein, partial [Suilimivivens sp.]